MDKQSKVNKLKDSLVEIDRQRHLLAEKSKIVEELKACVQCQQIEGADKDSLLDQNRQLREEVERLIGEIGGVKKELDSARNENHILGSHINSTELTNNEFKGKNEECLSKISSQQNQVRGMSNELSVAESDLKDFKSKQMKYFDLENMNSEYKRENSMLEEKVEFLERESDNWREKSKLLNDLESKLLTLATEYEKLVMTMADRNNEIETWRAKYIQLEINLQKLNEYEKRHSQLKNENSQFRKALEEKANELDEWISRYGHIANPMQEIEDYKKKLDMKNRETRQLEDKLLSCKEDFSREMAKLMHKFNEIDANKKRLMNQLEEKTEDGMVSKKKYENLCAQMESIKLQLETKFRGRLDDALNDITSKTEAEKSALEQHQGQANGYISELETRVTTFGADNERLGRLVEDKSRDNESLRIKLAGVEGNLHMLSNIQSQLSYLANENCGGVNKSGQSPGPFNSSIQSNKKF